jgi:hypothetical protein
VIFGSRQHAVHNSRRQAVPRLAQRDGLDRGSTAIDQRVQTQRRLLISHSAIRVRDGRRCCAPAGPHCRRRLTTACLVPPGSTRIGFDECTRHMHNPMYSPASGATSGGPSAGASGPGVRGMEPGRSPERASAERRSSSGLDHEIPARWVAESDCARRCRRQNCTRPTVAVQSHVNLREPVAWSPHFGMPVLAWTCAISAASACSRLGARAGWRRQVQCARCHPRVVAANTAADVSYASLVFAT